jgi:hypothetical protein
MYALLLWDSGDLTNWWSDPSDKSITDLSKYVSLVHPSLKTARLYYKDQPLNFFLRKTICSVN